MNLESHSKEEAWTEQRWTGPGTPPAKRLATLGRPAIWTSGSAQTPLCSFDSDLDPVAGVERVEP